MIASTSLLVPSMKCAVLPSTSLKLGDLFPVVGPVIAHRRGAVRDRHGFAAVFPALRSDVLGRIGGAEDQNVLVSKLSGIAEIMGVQDASVETLEPGIEGHIRH